MNRAALSTLETLFRILSTSTDLAAELPDLSMQDWQRLEQAAAQHDITLMLYHRLAPLAEFVPEEVRERLRAAYLQATARNLLILRHAGAILGALRDHGLDVIVLKGLYLAEVVYPVPSLRTFDDLDLLCRRAELPAALDALQGLGYQMSTWYDPADPNRDLKHLPPLLKPDAPIVELHWTILEEDLPITIDVDGLWQCREPARIADTEVSGLCSEDLVLHLALHGIYQHRLDGAPRALCDIAAVLRRAANGFNWQRLVSTAQQWGAQRVAWLTLRLLESLLGVVVPIDVFAQLLPDPPGEEIVEEALRQLAGPQQALPPVTPDLAALGQTRGFCARVSLVLRRVFLPRRVMAREYNVDPRSLKLYLYYPVRLFSLLREYHGTALRLLRGEDAALTAARREAARADLREWLGGE